MQLHITRPLLASAAFNPVKEVCLAAGGFGKEGLGRAYKIGGLPPLAPKASASELPRFWYGGGPYTPVDPGTYGTVCAAWMLDPPCALRLSYFICVRCALVTLRTRLYLAAGGDGCVYRTADARFQSYGADPGHAIGN